MSLNLIQPIISTVEVLLQDLAQDSILFDNTFGQVFGNGYDTTVAETLRIQWASGDFSQLPTLETIGSEVLGNAVGAYASSTNTIYLSQDFLETAPSSQILAVILEEIGHSVDYQININDSPGDEGEIFSALVRGLTLSEEDLQALQVQNDISTILLDGQWLSVEALLGVDAGFDSPLTLADLDSIDKKLIIQLQEFPIFQPTKSPSSPAAAHLVFIDSAVEDLQTLIRGSG